MKILLSAYACEPNKGSEPGVGWSWAIEYSKHHQVWVLTRDNNEQTIMNYLEEKPEYNNENLHFVYVSLPKKLTFWKNGRRGMRLFYTLWQRKAAKIARKLNKQEHFDFVQHVTFVSYTQASYMYKVGIPLIWGPVSGGENIPEGIKINMSKKESFIEIARKLSQTLALYSTSIRKTMKVAKVILTTTEETRNKIPKKYLGKTYVMPAIGVEKMPDNKREQHFGKMKIIMAGRLIYWKAFDIGIRAFMQVAKNNENIELHILGEGNQKERLKKLAGELANKQIFFDSPVRHDDIFEYYCQFDLFINTTLRDSGCMTMMEAMSVGVPSIAIATGGPRALLGKDSYCKVEPIGYEYCVKTIAEKLEKLIADEQMRENISKVQRERAADMFTMKSKVYKMEQFYRNM